MKVPVSLKIASPKVRPRLLLVTLVTLRLPSALDDYFIIGGWLMLLHLPAS